jgi:hypothetical protein
MTNTDFDKLAIRLFNTEEGQLVLKELHRRYVDTDIVCLDGEVASAIRAGKSELVRYLINLSKRKD